MKIMELEIKKVITETSDTKTLVFEKPVDLEFEPGQFFMIDVPFEGEERPTTRSYSTSSSPNDNTLDFTIKVIPGGKCSGLLCKSKVEDKYTIKGPFGKFIGKDEGKDIVFISGGSGVTPFRGMLRYLFEKGTKLQLHFFYSVQRPEAIIFHDQLKEFAEQHSNFHMYLTCTRIDEEEWDGLTGRFSIEQIKEKVGDIKNKVYYLCGGPEIVQTFEEALLKEGVPKENIRKERFY